MVPRPLILVPTPLERKILRATTPALPEMICCGFGLAAAAALSSHAIATHHPSELWLIGIAGSYRGETHPPGSAREYSETAVDGIGAGNGAEFLSPRQLGIPQFSLEGTRVFDRLPLGGPGGLLLSVCSASATPTEAERRRQLWPAAEAEDMEAFGAALSAHLHGLQLRVIRGISNLCGDRDKSRWCIDEALAAAGKLLFDRLEETAAP